MARIRSVHPSLFTDESWVSCTPLTRILYVGLWTDADDQGVFEWKPLQIKMRLLPGDAGDVSAMLAELESVNLVKAYEVEGKRYGAIANFRKFQRPQKPNAVHTLPDSMRDYVGIDGEDDDPATGFRKELCEGQGNACYYCATEITHYSKRATSCEVDHRIPKSKGGSDDESNLVAACRACNRGKHDRSESEWRAILIDRAAKRPVANASRVVAPQMEDGGGRGEETAKANALSVTHTRDFGFDPWWSMYPGAVAKPKARQAYAAAVAKIGGDDPGAVLMAGLRRSLASARWKDPTHTKPNPTRWLEEERWNDAGPEVTAAVQVALRQMSPELIAARRALLEQTPEQPNA